MKYLLFYLLIIPVAHSAKLENKNLHAEQSASQKIYFKEGQDDLNFVEQAKIKSFFKKLPKVLSSLELSAHTGQWGSSQSFTSRN